MGLQLVGVVTAIALLTASGISSEGGSPTGSFLREFGWQQVAGGIGDTCGVSEDGIAWCWGLNTYGQLGVGDTHDRDFPTRVDDAHWLGLWPGGSTCGVRVSHTLWCWGNNNAGQLGTGDTKSQRRPTRVGRSQHWLLAESGVAHACGIRTSGSLWCWGLNEFGQLGLGDQIDRHVPTQVLPGTRWADVVTGSNSTCAIQQNSTLWCWGSNVDGNLGLGRGPAFLTVPTEVGSRRGWVSIDLGAAHTCATRVDQTLWCWGNNEYGQLGVGDRKNRFHPTRVGTAHDWGEVATGLDGNHTCAITAVKTLWCWGYNKGGELGLGDTRNRTSPSEVGRASDWSMIHLGDQHSTALRGHTLWTWGWNLEGQLGLGDHRTRLCPRAVGVDGVGR